MIKKKDTKCPEKILVFFQVFLCIFTSLLSRSYNYQITLYRSSNDDAFSNILSWDIVEKTLLATWILEPASPLSVELKLSFIQIKLKSIESESGYSIIIRQRKNIKDVYNLLIYYVLYCTVSNILNFFFCL